MSEKFNVRSINISDRKGISKTPVNSAKFIAGHGIEGDSHAGPWNRQVTILSEEEITAADAGRGIAGFGSFAENLTVTGLNIHNVKLLDRFHLGDVILEVTQIGKVCHDNCAIGKALGECIMPRLGVFTRVIAGGELTTGREGEYLPKIFKGMVITLSDRASRGEYDDLSGPVAKEALARFFEEWGYAFEIINLLIPDDSDKLTSALAMAVDGNADIVLTSGGTGLGPRDFTPEVTAAFCERQIPGVMEFIRTKYGSQFPNALVSRGIAGVKNNTLIYNLPGSPKAVKEYLDEIIPTLRHTFFMLHGIDIH